MTPLGKGRVGMKEMAVLSECCFMRPLTSSSFIPGGMLSKTLVFPGIKPYSAMGLGLTLWYSGVGVVVVVNTVAMYCTTPLLLTPLRID